MAWRPVTDRDRPHDDGADQPDAERPADDQGGAQGPPHEGGNAQGPAAPHAVAGLLDEQIAYYRARADEYDATSWDGEPAREALCAALADADPRGDVLELACGPGTWTRELAGQARTLTAVDASPEMLALAQHAVAGRAVEFVCADLFAWRPPRRYDVIFFSAWLSHVPLQRFDAFWDMLGKSLAPGGRVLCIDETPAAAADESFVAHPAAPVVLRRLRSGERHLAVKVLWTPVELAQRLHGLGWETTLRTVGERFYFLAARRQGRAPARR